MAALEATFDFDMSAAPQPLAAPSFSGASGVRHSLQDHRGQFVLLNVRATWCPPCREELPTLTRLQTALADLPFQVIALSTDTGRVVGVRRLYQELGLDETDIFIDDTGSAMRSLTVFALPTTILVDPEGDEVGRFVGPAVWDSAEAQAFFRDILAKKQEQAGVSQ